MKKKIILMIFTLLLVSYIEPVMAMEVVKCGGLGGVPYAILKFIGRIIDAIKIIVPIMLIIMGMVDMAKATTANDEKKMQASVKLLIKRVIYALIVFFVIAIVQFIFKVFETSVSDTENDLLGCLNCVLGNECKTEEFKTGVSKSDTSGNAGDENKKPTVKVTKVIILQKKTEMEEGDTFTISAKVMPNTSTNKKLTYSSSKTSVATISSKGKIKAKKAGTTTITVRSASNKNKKATFKLEVVDPLDAKRQEVVEYAKKFKGKPYIYGGSWDGSEKYTATDCSGFTSGVYKHLGYTIPRTARDQASSGNLKTITPNFSKLKPGDLIFYAKNGRVNHVALYIGDSKVIHASNPTDGIKISTYNYRTPVKAKRVIY